MIKKLAPAVIVFLFFMIFSAKAFAGFDHLYTVGNNGGTAQQDNFGWNQIPWLYSSVSAASGAPLTVNATWTSPTGDNYSTSRTLLTGQVWEYLSNWSTVREAGLWNISANYSYSGGSGSGTTTFTVTPEPVSSALFLFGAAALVARFSKKKTRV
jgi:hypothetical protein